MKNYRELDCCQNCKFCFFRYEWDYPDLYFCMKDAPPRPKCMSVAMGECWDHDDDELYDLQYEHWEKWSAKKSVSAWGICDNYESKQGVE